MVLRVTKLFDKSNYNMKTFIKLILMAALMTGCTYYQQPATKAYSTNRPSKFDQSWSAAIGAFADQGVHITTQDRGAGVIQGTRNGIEVTGNIRTQANGSVRVEFGVTGAKKNDPTLIQRITGSYNGRMGR
ncbi:MAG: hypothetical protein DRQ62_03885 [Gammaproteobacteria bacterium]|nr:MAG: hypothetical protein DRQ62_03885 [Gammaproteobacteria bacterium]